MKTFLAEVVETILSENENISDIIFVVPGKRAGVFLKREIQNRMTRTVFAPQISSVEEFVQELSGLSLISNIQLIFEFYAVYQKNTPQEQQEDFYNFSKWAQVMLQDFNEIDRYLIAPEDIFSHLSSVKELDHWYLSDQKTPLQEQYIEFWKTLGTYYTALREELLAGQCGYQGLIYREAIENIEHYLHHNNHRKHIFIGFNALNNAESSILQEFLAAGAEVYWDTDRTFMEDPEHDAGLFMRQYKRKWKYYQKNPFKHIDNRFSEPKNIEIIGIPGKTGQAMYVHAILSELKNREELEGTAVVLGNEELLNPVLNAIPEDLEGVNITGGFPLAYSPVASWFHAFFQTLENEQSGKWYYQNVLNLVSHPVSKTLLFHKGRDLASGFIRTIQDNNIVFVTQEHLQNAFSELIADTGKDIVPVTELLFFSRENTTADDVIRKCSALTLRLKEVYALQGNQVFLEYLYRFYEIFNQIRFFNEKYQAISIHALTGIYRELLLQQTVDFQGEPLEGLQVMGVLESRNLDYETVILTSVNEGDLPSGKSGNSFIPFDIKIAYGLPTYKEKDAIYAYHFYRLLQRTRNVYLLYNSDPGSFDGGEKSRFIQQLTTFRQENHSIRERIAVPKVGNLPGPQAPVQKTPSLMETIRIMAEKGFSPTSLSNYIRNPIEFYKQSVLKVSDEYEVEETIAANTLGTIIHDTLEDLYKPLTGQVLTPDHVADMQSKVNGVIALKFAEVYKGGDFSRGKNLLSYEVAKQYLKNFLEAEAKRIRDGNAIKIIEIESNLKVPIDVPGISYPVYLKGKVDRVEETNGVLCFIDYKTGRVDQADVELAEWENLIIDYKYSKAFQLLCYSYMLTRNSSYSLPAEAAIISFKNLQKGFLKFAKKGASRSEKDYGITEETFRNFKEQLYRLISEICDPEIPFAEKEDQPKY
ncbi:PD-(D/E)XK nuclease family protein [Sinomicrobium pectinilyticum]|uniref:PD-(D/E)XK nuclease family protein n=1 Tax=Sinomicrobium pectinilyticum TaxID=1084421 RepID=A0A3N0EYR5_SINP1|nr:PD-(D/E)XK nuclease family protein [Sinomicrobium pectinilyticum]RNL92971.1 PD-(D/E)XK nuclease family protein [Sinomicrobium pectinilyticum]